MSRLSTLNTVTTAMLTAVAVILARALHYLGGMDVATLFSPMHLPILLLGILCGALLGGIGGLLTPVLSFAISGMPPFPNGLVPMAVELALYGILAGCMRNIFLANPKSNSLATILALIVAMVVGRIANAVVGAILLTITTNVSLGITLLTKLLTNFASTWLAIILQLILIPLLLLAMQRTGVLSNYLTDEQVERFLSRTNSSPQQ